MEFWNSNITERSWNKLNELKKEIDFVLIGGWAVYLYTKLYKSKDIDIIVDYGVLRALSKKYVVNKNERLRKYEIKLDEFDIDIYLPKYSDLPVPPEEIATKLKTNIGGFSAPTPEALAMLKLGAIANRMESVKGQKDAIDILGMLFYSGLSVDKLGRLLKTYNREEYVRLLLRILNGFDKSMLSYLNLNEKSFARLRREYADKIKHIL